jgi:hypothetical protein
MKQEEKWKQWAKQGSPMSPPNSKGFQWPTCRLATPWMQKSSPTFVQVKQSCIQSILINKLLTSFSIPIKIVQLLNYLATCSFTTIGTCKKLMKLKLITNLKLTCTQIIKNLKKVGWKRMIHVSKWKNETHNQKWNQKSLKQVCPPSLILAILKYNSHN